MRIDHDSIHTRLGSLAEPTRTRLLALLAKHELSVGELCAAAQLPQSTVSRHLKLLLDEGWVVSRPDGQSRYYRLATDLEPSARQLWQVVAAAVDQGASAPPDQGKPTGADEDTLAIVGFHREEAGPIPQRNRAARFPAAPLRLCGGMGLATDRRGRRRGGS